MNQQIKTGLGAAVLIIIAITVGTFIWIFEKDKSIETDMQTVKVNSVRKQEVPKVFDKTALESAVFSAVDVATKNIWDKKIEVSAVDPSQKAAKGAWWAKDQWSWIAWQKEDGSWNVEVDRDGFDCSGLKNIPVAYEKFFHDAIRFNGALYCYDWKDKVSDGNVYRNEKFGFQLTLPEKWSNYSVKEGKDGMGYSFVGITVPDNSKPVNMISMMSIMFYDKKTWKPNDNNLIGMKVGENAKYYFYYTPGLQDDIPGTEGMREMADNTMKTLRAL